MKEFVPIDLDHPVVKELLGMGYEPERCLEAAVRFPDDVTQAHEYLVDSGEKGQLFASSIPAYGFDKNGPLWDSDSALLMEVDVEEETAQPVTDASSPILDRYVQISILFHCTFPINFCNSWNYCLSLQWQSQDDNFEKYEVIERIFDTSRIKHHS